jgi:hypothetical protein
MAVVTEPNVDVLAVYDTGIYFQFTDTIPTATGDWKQMVVQVRDTDSGDIVATFRKAYDELTVVGPNTTATFSVDPSEILRTMFCRTSKGSNFGLIGQEYKASNADLVFFFELEINYEYVDTVTGLVTQSATTDLTSEFTILNSTLKDIDTSFYTEFIDPATTPDRQFLSYRPLCVDICPNENDFLSWWKDQQSDFFRVITVDSGGLSNYIVPVGALIPDGMVTIGSGPAQLNNTTPLVGSISITDDTEYYTVQFGEWDGIVFTPASEIRKFKVVGCCPEIDCRLFWVNRLGGVDAFTFSASVQQEDNPTSTRYEKPLPIPKVTLFQDYGFAKFDSRNSTVHTITSKFLNNDVAQWLVELQTSIRVCKTVQSTESPKKNLFPIIIQDTRNVLKNRPNGTGIVRTVVFEFANEDYIQQYG